MSIYKYIVLLLVGILAFMQTGCQQNMPQTDIDNTLFITGNSCLNFNGLLSRASSYKLTDEDKILLYSTGGLSANGEELTYRNGIWHQAIPLKWNEQPNDAQIWAYYPAERIKTNNLYQENGELADVLYNHQKATYRNNITLSFSHFFSKLNFTIEQSLNNQIEYVEFTPSIGVESINLSTGISVCSEKSKKTIRIERHNDCNYSLIIPTNEVLTINITLATTNGNKAATVAARSYERGYLYQCNIKEEKNNIGIFTTEDFIAFTHLMNGESYESRHLDEFREENKDGTYTYYLRNDITLTDDDNAKMTLIGKKEADTFGDIFDGMNHTISNLKIQPNTYNTIRTALFLYNTGTIKNLTLNNAEGTFSSKSFLSLLVAYNKGVIDNCHVKNATIAITMTDKDKYAAGIAASNIGTITNCSCDDVSIKVNKKDKQATAGIMVTNHNSANGRMLNCYISNSSLTNTGLSGGLCGRMQNGSVMENCYESNITFKNCSSKGALTGSNDISFVKHCFYEYGQEPISKVSTISDNYAYSATVTDPKTAIPVTEVVTRLNEWINATGSSTYSEYTFTNWKNGESIPAIFVNTRTL